MRPSKHWLENSRSGVSRTARGWRQCILLLGVGLLLTPLAGAGEAGAKSKGTAEPQQSSRTHLLWDDEDLLIVEGGMTIDADGAPRAYSPIPEQGLDALEHAGSSEHWDGIATTENGEPIVQGPHDPAPGYYVSTTALEDHSYPPERQQHYVDASVVPYIALPASDDGPQLGDVALVLNTRTRRASPAIFADISDVPGEGSIALAEQLDVNSDARRGGTDRGIVYVVFKNSGTGAPAQNEKIDGKVQELWSAPDVQDIWNNLCSQHPAWTCDDEWTP